MTQKEISEKIQEILRLFGGKITSEDMKMLLSLELEKQNQQQIKMLIQGIHEQLDYLGLCIKYLLFDLEATRRENSYLQKMLEETEG